MRESVPAGDQSTKAGQDQPGAANSPGFTVPQVPTISLPKGGGAIRGIGEKFAANPVTGTGSMTVPIATSPGRSGFGPQLALSYDSGAGNGPFGLGWNLALPSITRKTDKGLPTYQDGMDSDVFLLSGAEDLVPIFEQDDTGNWQTDGDGRFKIYESDRTIGGTSYRIRRYRPRIEGLFARIERWSNNIDRSDVFWRSISRDNVTTWYGKTAASRIADPADAARIFNWLICQSYDDKGNVVTYDYKPENSDNVDLSQAHEHCRGDKTDLRRTANQYLKTIRYGNHKPYLPGLAEDKKWPELPHDGEWYFEVVFDYGEHDAEKPSPEAAKLWDCRSDSFSTYRPGFEIRTYRLCQRVLMFHHFPDEDDEKGYDGLVRSTDFTYEYEVDAKNARVPIFSKLSKVSLVGYQPREDGSYLPRSLPPVEFTYSDAAIQTEVRELTGDSLENLPMGLDGANYQWVDLDGEGLSGVLSEQAGAWFYKRNLSPINLVGSNDDMHLEAKFAPLELVTSKPAITLANHGQFLDLAGDGRPDVVQFAGPTPGFYERTIDERWESLVPFIALPNLDWSDTNIKFIDLDGDGHTDILITEDEAFVWYRSLGEDGFGAAQRAPKGWDKDQGPHVVFADGEQAIYLADMSGDGLTDIARIRNGEVCYWPNLGYGRFGVKVTMDNAPWFDTPDQFDHRRLRVADIDGTGTTDILYLHRRGVRVYFNQSGNSWSAPTAIDAFPMLDNVVGIQALDLLGNGTACLVWSSPLQADARRPVRYLDLMGGQKPHLLVRTVNNLGAETIVEYAPSTKFYLLDKQAGQPWATKLPFPVHCVERVTVFDKWRQVRFATTYSYHHGYFDGPEREFRGFGRVEQVDAEDYGTFAATNSNSGFITEDKRLFQPPVKTVTWFHTGAFLDRERILSQFRQEYFSAKLKALGSNFTECDLSEPDLDSLDLSNEEWREALRACKGMTLRQETYELDVHALAAGEQRQVKIFTAAEHNCHIHLVQPRGGNQHAVFHVTESEALTYHYELALVSESTTPDPRIAHTLNLRIDDYGNVCQSVSVVYGRSGKYSDDTLDDDVVNLIDHVQSELHVGYTETRYTHDIPRAPFEMLPNQLATDNFRLCLPYEVLTYELTGLELPADSYFTLDYLRSLRLSDHYQNTGITVAVAEYHEPPEANAETKRLVEHVRTLFFDATLSDSLPLSELSALGLAYESYRLALTDTLLNLVFKDKLTPAVQAALNDRQQSGYLSGAEMKARFGEEAIAGQYWLCAGVAGFNADAAQNFFLPERYTDPFGNITTLTYKRDLYVHSSTDPLGNTSQVARFDYRVLAPLEMQDINGNYSEVFFDALGLPVAMAVKGKGAEGDNLTGFTVDIANPSAAALRTFFDQADLDGDQAHSWLGNATARHVYYLGEELASGKPAWGVHPACACGLVRERHVSQLAPGEQSPLQAAFEYTDGLGSVIVKKVQAEPLSKGGPLRWVANGKTILNNKGKPVKQYEPYFCDADVGHLFEDPLESGVSRVIYYDPVGRVIRTDIPDGSYSRVEFSPWYVLTYDQNDTVLEPGNGWYQQKTSPTATSDQKTAAKRAAEHAGTPALTLLDSLGREVIAVAHNRVRPANDLVDVKYVTFTKLDAEGKPLWVQDARRNRVMQYITPPRHDGGHPFDHPSNKDPQGFSPCYDIAGNLLFQHSADAGERWMLNDAAGKPMFAWDSRSHIFRTEYDKLHRTVRSYVTGANGDEPGIESLVERTIYGEQHPQAESLNLRGRVFKQLDQAGVVTIEDYDFKGNLLSATRALAREYKRAIDWSNIETVLPANTLDGLDLANLEVVLAPQLESETFYSSTRYDALNRTIQAIAPHSDRPGTKINITQPGYNEAKLLERIDVWLNQNLAPMGELDPATASLHAVTNIDYDEKGRRLRIDYNESNHPIVTTYRYDKETFRLIRKISIRPNHPEPNKRRVQDLTYTYDPTGNIIHIADAAQPRIYFANDCVDASNEYRYDALYRLVAATGREHKGRDLQPDWDDGQRMGNLVPFNCSELRRYVETYRYDAVGNVVQMVHHLGSDLDKQGKVVWNRRYQYPIDNNRLRCTSNYGELELPDYSDGLTQYTQHYIYDVQGNMTWMPHLPLMQWSYRDQLRATSQQVSNDGATSETTYYVYDAAGQRVRKVTELTTRQRKDERIYLGGFEVYHSYGMTPIVRDTLLIIHDQQCIALVETRAHGSDGSPAQLIRYQFDNHLGSATAEFDETGETITYEEYYPYGSTSFQALRNGVAVSPKRYRYTGKERDEGTGLYYQGMRYYACWIARWTSADPAGMIDGPNLYLYVMGNPVRLKDPSGQDSEVDKQIAQMDDVQLHRHLAGLSAEQRTSFARGATGKFAERAWGTLNGGKMEIGYSFSEDTISATVSQDAGSFSVPAIPEGRSPCPTCHGAYGAPLPQASVGDDPVQVAIGMTQLTIGAMLGADSGTGTSAESRRSTIAKFDETPQHDPAEAKSLPTRPYPTLEAALNVAAAKAPGILAKAVGRGLEADAALAKATASRGFTAPHVGPTSTIEPVRRWPAIFDADALSLAEKGHAGAMGYLRDLDPHITLSQLREFLDVKPEEQPRLARFLLDHNVKPLSSSYGQLSSPELRDTFWKIAKVRGTGDASLVVNGIQSKFSIVTSDKKLINTLVSPLKVSGVHFYLLGPY